MMRTAGQPNTFGRGEGPDEKSESSGGASPLGEPIQFFQCGYSRLVRINSILVYQMADMEMVNRVRDCPVYMVDYFTSTVTPKYLEPFREEF